jgi:glyoxylase-like metal-dependent hydrolase (beta-lactamase superfamily II)
MSRFSIYPVQLGMTRCYLVCNDGVILIDGGMPGKVEHFKEKLRWLPVRPEEIKLILLTHGHFDHIGSVRGIQELTGAKVALHRCEKDWLEKPMKPIPPGVTPYGRLLGWLLSRAGRLTDFPPAQVDLPLDDEGLSLGEFGIPGKVVYTPGHTSGSVTVLLESGEAFVGDLAMNAFPLRLTPGLPVIAEDFPKVKESWQKLLEMGVKTIFPAHGKPFPVEIIQHMIIGQQ